MIQGQDLHLAQLIHRMMIQPTRPTQLVAAGAIEKKGMEDLPLRTKSLMDFRMQAVASPGMKGNQNFPKPLNLELVQVETMSRTTERHNFRDLRQVSTTTTLT